MKRGIIVAFIIFFSFSATFSQSLLPDFSDDGNNYSQSLLGFGQGVAIWNNTAVVTYPNNAAAYVYQFNGSTWQKIAVLKPSTPNTFARFGYGVDIYDSIIVIGAPKENNSKGAAYVYIRPATGWADTTESFKLLPNTSSSFPSYFGQSVLVRDSLILIGAPYEDTVGAMNGCVYMYDLDIGSADTAITLFKKLVPDAAQSDALEFGWSMDMQDRLLVVGSNSTEIPGYVHVFAQSSTSGWNDVSLLARLALTDGQVQEFLGYSVKIAGKYIIAGAPGWDGDSADVGRVAVFYSADGLWDDYQTAVISCPIQDRGLGYGEALEFYNNVLIVGMPGYNNKNENIGAVDIIPVPESGSWLDTISEHNIWEDPNGYEDMLYGQSMALNEKFLIIGAPRDNLGENSLGKAYFYYYPVLYHNPDDRINACTYEDIKFRVRVLGDASFQWYQSTDNGLTFSPLSDNSQFTGTNTPELVIISSTVEDSSLFKCLVSGNIVSRSSDSARLTWDKIKPYVTIDTITVYLDSTGKKTITGNEFGPTDNCSVRDWVLTENTFVCGQTFVRDTIIIRDNCGNIDTIPVFVIVQDTIKPGISWIQNEYDRYLDSTGQAAVGDVNVDIYENCKIVDMHYAFDSVDCSMLTFIYDTLFVTDQYGNSVWSPFKINVFDTIKPFLAIPPQVNLFLDSLGHAKLTESQAVDSAWDNCSVQDTVLNTTDFDCSDLGQNYVKVGIVDEAGLITRADLAVNIADTIIPFLEIISQISLYLDSSGIAVLSPSQVIDSVWDNCALVDTTISQSLFDCSQIGEQSVTVSVTDRAGLTNSKVLTVNVSDTIKPYLSVPSRVYIYLDSSGTAVLTPSAAVDSAWDNCGLTDTILSRTEFRCLSYGLNNVTVKVVDVSGLQKSAGLQVVVSDTIKPYLKVFDLFTVFLDSDGVATVKPEQLIDSLWDNCIIADTSVSQTLFTCDDLGFQTVTVTVTDLDGNSVSKQVTLEVSDTISPTITCHPATFYLDSTGRTSVSSEDLLGEISDNCSIGNIGISQHEFDCSDLGENDITVFADDRVGNIGECQTIVTIADTIKPYLATPAQITTYLDSSGIANITPNQLIDSVWDNCGIADTSVSQLNFSCQDIGTNNVIVTVTDVSGLTVQRNVTVFVRDTVSPVLLLKPADTLYLDANGQAELETSQIVEYMWDNCSARLTFDASDYSCADLGADTVTMALTDPSGNSVSSRTVIFVLDTLKPVLTCSAEMVRTADASGVYVVQGDEFDPLVTENCDFVLTNSYNDSLSLDGAVFTPDTTDVVWYVTDGSGNTDSCQTHIIIRQPVNTSISPNMGSLKIYPNPADDKLTVEFVAASQRVKIEIWSVEGKKILSMQPLTSPEVLNISDLPAGAYVLRFIANGQVRAVYFVKK